MITHAAEESHPLVLPTLVVQHRHGEGLVVPSVVVPVEDEAEVSLRPLHLCEVAQGRVQSGERAEHTVSVKV